MWIEVTDTRGGVGRVNVFDMKIDELYWIPILANIGSQTGKRKAGKNTELFGGFFESGC